MTNLYKFPVEGGVILDATSRLNENFDKSFYQGGLLTDLSNGSVSITSTATLISNEDSDRFSILVKNNSTNTLYVGSSGVTTSNGFALQPSQSIYLLIPDAIYAIGVSGTNNIRFLEVTK